MKIYLAFIIIFASCQQKKQDKLDQQANEAIAQMENQKGTFDPAKYVSLQSSHWAITGRYSGGNYEFDTTAVSVRPGRTPHLPERKPALPFVVSYFAADGRLIGQYSIENPVESRTCEDGQEGRRFNEGSIFEILLPADQAISHVQVQASGKRVGSFRVPQRKRQDGISPTDTTGLRQNRS